MSALNTTIIKPAIGAIVHDIDLNHITDEQMSAIKALLLDRQVIFFRGQSLSPTAQADFARNFGELHIHPVFPTTPESREIIVLDSHATDLRDNELWHTDVTFSKTPPLGCVLQAIKIPESGGDTLWASSKAAYDALPEDTKQKIKGLTAVHDIRLSFPEERFGMSDEEKARLDEIYAKNPPVTHPVVRTHPDTKAQGLFVTEGFTDYIKDMPREDSDELLQALFAHSVKDEFTLRWQWQAGDIAIWDNRATQHKALFDYGDAHRIMHRATVLGDEPYYQEA
ncbi:taurine dioxygenase [Moraxella caviae]|uniref:Taurine dioxygenase n=1 Tax=Moraxella caviae TaxID=34060 RepID=A0A1T0A6L4_9GAMM|nr:taurine dioxygenase [Moraxella caviae]OOR91337.1 taurine dioxygenase [Moraxella caviae]STZ13947.1 Alpha-ketoglutarate-dependent taurine dioxygenase [Moraxella caviae]